MTITDEVATKADIAELRGDMNSQLAELGTQIKLLTNLVIGLYIGLALLLVDKLMGQ